MYYVFKRLLDIVISFTVLLVLLPVFIPLCILLRLTGEGEIFYFQRRIGYKSKYFDIWKFATMLKNSPNMGTGMITLRNDSRVTPMGGFLRMTKLNELPQIINVLKGDMSIVGPRPLVDKTFNAYPENIRYKIYDSKPGITGIGSIVFRDEEHLLSTCSIPPQEYYDTVIAPYKGELEIWYNRRKSILVDFQIMFLTAWVILFPKSDMMHTVFKDLPKRNF
ncbi:sugar transferase [Chitinophaga sp. Mgbs1]|uniref:Sugar transferase n=1 Tax=Chitinophaga solisilvae TaxID=1233460 RepID=A0A433WBB5_9BACT|nr:sugar transferase [Chitinophaga solisilvae]